MLKEIDMRNILRLARLIKALIAMLSLRLAKLDCCDKATLIV